MWGGRRRLGGSGLFLGSGAFFWTGLGSSELLGPCSEPESVAPSSVMGLVGCSGAGSRSGSDEVGGLGLTLIAVSLASAPSVAAAVAVSDAPASNPV